MYLKEKVVKKKKTFEALGFLIVDILSTFKLELSKSKAPCFKWGIK